MSDTINHPDHYTQGGIECINAIRSSMPRDAFMGYCQGNILKYLWRHRIKGGLEDLKKAERYLQWMITAGEEEV